MGADVADRLPRLEATDTAALEHECALAATEAAETVVHIPEVLCHRTQTPGGQPTVSSFRYVEEALRRRHDASRVVVDPDRNGYRIERPDRTQVPVSILIPFRDEPRLLRTCVDSIVATTGAHASVEIVLIDNGSSDPETLTLVERLADNPDVRVVSDPRPFNWAALNNAGAQEARRRRPAVPQQRHRGAPRAVGCPPCAPRRCDRTSVPPERGFCTRTGGFSTADWSSGLTGAAGHVLGGLPEDRARLSADGDRCPRVLGGDGRLPGHTARRLRSPGWVRRDARVST